MTQQEWELYLEGVLTGLRAFAHWKNGQQYVGTLNTTLQEAEALATKGYLYGQRSAPRA